MQFYSVFLLLLPTRLEHEIFQQRDGRGGLQQQRYNLFPYLLVHVATACVGVLCPLLNVAL